MVQVGINEDPQAAAQGIAAAIPGVTPIVTNNLFRGQREQIVSLLNSVVVLLGITWVLSMALIAVVFSLAVNERRRQIGVLRALGARRPVVLRSLLLEALLLALAGGLAGIAVAGLALYLMNHQPSLSAPLVLPLALLFGMMVLSAQLRLGGVYAALTRRVGDLVARDGGADGAVLTSRASDTVKRVTPNGLVAETVEIRRSQLWLQPACRGALLPSLWAGKR